MPFYESVFIARQDISAQQVESLTQSFGAIIEAGGGRVAKTEYWGVRNLAYRIKKNRKGHYVLMNIDAAPAAIQEFERNMRINEDVIRFLTVRVDEIDEGPSIVMQVKAARDERRRDGDRGFRGGRDGDRGFRGGRGGDRAPTRAASGDDRAPTPAEAEAEPEKTTKTEGDAS